MLKKSKEILKTVFGYDRYRPLQEEIIENVLNKNDTLVIMPTGGGKSLCYQIPALLFSGLTIVVSPLISLMKDQVEQLLQTGTPAAFLNSSLGMEAYRRNVSAVKEGAVKLLYMAPEALLKPGMLSLLDSLKVDCLAIDEAHCISEWGHDFRPEYRQIAAIRSRFPNAVCVALTATATPRVREDIQRSLGFTTSDEFVGSFNRENLFIRVEQKVNPFGQTLACIEAFPNQSGIIYCFSRRQVDDLYEALAGRGYSVRPYHAGLSDTERDQNQEAFIRDDVQIIVATIAFGMGIDKPNVRFVVHYDMPKNLEGYYQEIGRAGRDGLPSHCLLLFSYGDIRKVKHFIDKKAPSEQRAAIIHLNALLGFMETAQCRRIPLLNYFGEAFSTEDCGACDNCAREEKDLHDVTVAAQKFLSCVKRTGERFGAGHIIDVLRGSQAKKVLQFGHDSLSTYGIGEEHSKKQWFQLSRQFVQQKLLVQDMEYGGLSLTEKAWRVMRGEEKVLGSLEERRGSLASADKESRPHDNELFEILRRERKRLADEVGAPPYIIFPDRTLMEMAVFFPQKQAHLSGIHGIGAVKGEKYGPAFLKLIQEYCAERGIEEDPGLSVRAVESAPTLGTKKRHEVVGELYNAGDSVAALMEAFHIKRNTVLQHLLQYCREGHAIRQTDEFLSFSTLTPETRETVLHLFKTLGVERMRPVFDALEGQVDYDELRILQIYYMAEAEYAQRADGAASALQEPTAKEIVCLANSRKFSGRCIAGKEIMGNRIGPWIRPVSAQETGELSLRDICYPNGSSPRLLDVVAVPLTRHHPHSCQTENYLVANEPWVPRGVFSSRNLSGLCDPADSLWVNGYNSATGLNDRIPEAIVREEISSSLLFIQPEKVVISVEEGPNLLKRIRTAFAYGGEKYRFAVTDPLIEEKYVQKAIGDYPLAGDNVYFTISISEPYEGFCYKLVAGIVGFAERE